MYLYFVSFRDSLQVSNIRPQVGLDRWPSGKQWYLKHNCVGDTIIYRYVSEITFIPHHIERAMADDDLPTGDTSVFFVVVQ